MPDASDSEVSMITPKLTLVSNPGQFDCSHVFHFECLEQWFKESTRCPLCNLDYAKNTMRMMSMVDQAGPNLTEPAHKILESFSEVRERYC